MPNWCNNTVRMANIVKRFTKNGEFHFCFNDILKMPEELENTVAPHDHPNWYEWRLAYWGTKWDVDDVDRLDNDTIFFETAWCPPEGILAELSRKYKTTVSCEWDEEGGCAGYLEYRNGVCVKDEARESHYWDDYEMVDYETYTKGE